ncbi:MAG TPA: MerR family transcriptional regulator [Thermaerobacter sp.]
MSRHRHLPLYSIGAVCHLTGLSQRRVRYYEQAGLLRPARTAGNQRRYSQADVERLLEIKCLLQQGLPIGEIRRRLALDERRHEEVAGPSGPSAAMAAGGWPPLPVSGGDGGRTAPTGIDRLFRGPAPDVPGVGGVRSLYPALDPAVLYHARRRRRGRGEGGDGPAAG